AGRHLAALGDVHFLDHAAGGGRNVHGRLFGLQRDEGSFGFDRLTRFDADVDYRGVLEVAHVGHTPFYEAGCRVHRVGFFYTFQGTGLDGSTPSALIAFTTVARSTLPSSARALRAATAMWLRSTSKCLRRAARESERPKPSVPSVT